MYVGEQYVVSIQGLTTTVTLVHPGGTQLLALSATNDQTSNVELSLYDMGDPDDDGGGIVGNYEIPFDGTIQIAFHKDPPFLFRRGICAKASAVIDLSVTLPFAMHKVIAYMGQDEFPFLLGEEGPLVVRNIELHNHTTDYLELWIQHGTDGDNPPDVSYHTVADKLVARNGETARKSGYAKLFPRGAYINIRPLENVGALPSGLAYAVIDFTADGQV